MIRASRKVIAVVVAVLLLTVNAPAALAFPPLPSSFYGTVKIDNTNVPAGTLVSAWINGVRYAHVIVSTYQGDTTYSLDVPGDDPATPGAIEGGREGDVIVFRIGNNMTAQTSTWHSGTNVQVNLTGSPTAVNLQSLTARASAGTADQPGSLLAVLALGLCGLALIWQRQRKL